jgi:hypothetical protein
MLTKLRERLGDWKQEAAPTETETAERPLPQANRSGFWWTNRMPRRHKCGWRAWLFP